MWLPFQMLFHVPVTPKMHLLVTCKPPVKASINKDTAINMSPHGLSFLPTFFLLPPKLKMQTPSVIAATYTHSALIRFAVRVSQAKATCMTATCRYSMML